MITYTSGRTLLGSLTGDTSSTNLTVMDTLHNEAIREIVSTKPWGFRQKTVTRSTETDNVHNLPADCAQVLNITVTPDGTTKYTPRRIKSRDEWDRLTQSTNVTSNIPEAYFIFDGTYSFYPMPSSAETDAITIAYQRRVKDLSVADYTTGTIVSIASGATTVTGSGTSWTAAMAGRYIRITDSDTANKGDGLWYEVASVTSATVLELVSPYGGTSISAGSANYTIGQTSIIPEDHQMTAIYRAVESYFSYIQPEKDRAQLAKLNFQERMRTMQIECGAMAAL
jgi:hypothetical protein